MTRSGSHPTGVSTFLHAPAPEASGAGVFVPGAPDVGNRTGLIMRLALHSAPPPVNRAFVRENGSRAIAFGLQVEGSGVEWGAVAGAEERSRTCRPELTGGPLPP
ncbi:hypothetical protein GCM10010112_50520 [Actinoplanes lobatus]|nr:hypothetical protein GCM10010112_50520 [Actinoplanes lobatus]